MKAYHLSKHQCCLRCAHEEHRKAVKTETAQRYRAKAKTETEQLRREARAEHDDAYTDFLFNMFD